MKRLIGLEKEALYFNNDMTPINIDYKDYKKNFTMDFANHQVEIVTDPLKSNKEVYNNLNRLVNDKRFKDYLIWPNSIPPLINNNVKNNKKGVKYRNYLLKKYGLDKMLISGIHFNYSNNLLSSEEEYFELLKKAYLYAPILMQFVSFTPYMNKPMNGLEKFGKNYGLKDSITLRSSFEYGYSNKVPLKLNYSSLKDYKQSIKDELKKGNLYSHAEIYNKVRLKNYKGSNYIELRFIDLNPYYSTGISKEVLTLIDVVLSYLSRQNKYTFKQKTVLTNIDKFCLKGLNHSLKYDINGKTDSLHNHTLKLFNNILKESYLTKEEILNIKTLLNDYRNKTLDIHKYKLELDNNNWSLEEFSYNYLYNRKQFIDPLPTKDLELSTKLLYKHAKDRGYKVNILSEKENILEIISNKQKQIVIQATKTNLDKYVDILLMNNKFMTKKILKEYKIKVPQGILISSSQDKRISNFFKKDIVIKPLDANFGLGIHILKNAKQKEVYECIKDAFKYASSVIIEEYIQGIEYRFLVIDNKVISIIQRNNASVVGNNKDTIKQLIKEKNNDYLRGSKYKKPLEKIIIDSNLKAVLKRENLTVNSIPALGQKVLLRDTSNVSQGGDSFEVSHLMDKKYKEVATNTVKALNVKISGVDIIIDPDTKKYAVIEANFNPALHMHAFPYKGIGKDAASNILDLLFK
ncbi:MAG: bifunctional glutamate--cysteine ligase GshA/glutathione synthetase GshB [Mycoplasmatales bacterium]